MKPCALAFLVCLTGIVGVAPVASAQLASQTALVGTVTDSGGGVLPGATVVAVETLLGERRFSRDQVRTEVH